MASRWFTVCAALSLYVVLFSCATKNPVHLPEEELSKLFQVKEQVEADGRFVKRKLEDSPSSASRKEVVAFKEQYFKLYGSYNGVIEFLRTRIGSGGEPSDYVIALKKDVAAINNQADQLHLLRGRVTGPSRGPFMLDIVNTAAAHLAELVVSTINASRQIEADELARQRENVKAQLAQQRMKEFSDL